MRHVYLANIEGTDIYKIGFTKNPKNRLKSLQTGNPKKLVLVDSFESELATQIESVLHRRYMGFKTNNIDGDKLLGEWFELDHEQASSFIYNCQKIHKNLKSIKGNR
jgi:hypothetical protein